MIRRLTTLVLGASVIAAILGQAGCQRADRRVEPWKSSDDPSIVFRVRSRVSDVASFGLPGGGAISLSAEPMDAEVDLRLELSRSLPNIVWHGIRPVDYYPISLTNGFGADEMIVAGAFHSTLVLERWKCTLNGTPQTSGGVENDPRRLTIVATRIPTSASLRHPCDVSAVVATRPTRREIIVVLELESRRLLGIDAATGAASVISEDKELRRMLCFWKVNDPLNGVALVFYPLRKCVFSADVGEDDIDYSVLILQDPDSTGTFKSRETIARNDLRQHRLWKLGLPWY